MKAVKHECYDEESNGWPWIIEARARDAEAIEGMTIEEQLVYYRRMAAIARAEREQQGAIDAMRDEMDVKEEPLETLYNTAVLISA